MNDWFTTHQLDRDTYAISEYRHWEETHCYLLLGSKRAVLIDTGLGIADIKSIVESLTNLPVLAVTTHVHWDHIGGHRFFEHFAVHQNEVAWIAEQFPVPLSAVKASLVQGENTFPASFDPERYQIFQGQPTQVLSDNEIIDLGNRQLQVIHTPGHSPGHLCFYETERKYLFTGDLIYQGCLYAFYPTTNPLEFMKSVDRVQSLDCERVFPAHHKLDIPVSLNNEVAEGFHQIWERGELEQGRGIFHFANYSIHI